MSSGITIDEGSKSDSDTEGVETLRTDGNAIDIDLTQTVEKGDYFVDDEYFGIAMEAGSSGDTIAMEIAQRVHEISIGELTGAKGDIIYITTAGVLTTTVGTNKPFMKVVQEKDSNNYIWGLLLPQMTTQA